MRDYLPAGFEPPAYRIPDVIHLLIVFWVIFLVMVLMMQFVLQSPGAGDFLLLCAGIGVASYKGLAIMKDYHFKKEIKELTEGK